jgi:hypothetical protein
MSGNLFIANAPGNVDVRASYLGVTGGIHMTVVAAALPHHLEHRAIGVPNRIVALDRVVVRLAEQEFRVAGYEKR